MINVNDSFDQTLKVLILAEREKILDFCSNNMKDIIELAIKLYEFVENDEIK